MLLLAMVVMVGLAFTTARSGPAVAAPSFSAWEIANGVLFNDGPAAERMAALRRPATPWTRDLRDLQESTRRMVESDSVFVRTFPRQMQSGDPRQVEAGLTELGSVARRVLEERFDPEVIDKSIFELDTDWIPEKLAKAAALHMEFALDNGKEWAVETNYVVAENVALALELAVAVVIAYAIALVKTFPKENPEWTNATGANLAKEVLVADLARDLRAGG
jgi:SdpC family antimicrobial peptide